MSFERSEKVHERTSSRSYSRYPAQIPSIPLIDRVTNEWQSNLKYRDSMSDGDSDGGDYSQFLNTRDTSCPNLPWMSYLPRRVQRYLILYILFLVVCFCGWKFWLAGDDGWGGSLDEQLMQAGASSQFGTNARPNFTGLRQLQFLESRLRPGASHGSPKRLLVIGDAHGCKEELVDLLKTTGFDSKTDHLIFTGDMIYRGPDSAGVVELAQSYGASCVRGNHEDRVLLAYASMHGSAMPLPSSSEEPMTKQTKAEDVAASHGDLGHRKLAEKLNKEHISWLQSCPVILHLGKVGGKAYVVVHGGLSPGVSLEKQDPFQVMNMRTIDKKTGVPSEARAGEPWFKLWNSFQKSSIPSKNRVTVLYGHDSKRGLSLKKYTKGLDSGCVKGGKLSALIVDVRGNEKVVSVKCKDYTVTG